MKLLSIIFVIILIIGLVGCAKTVEQEQPAEADVADKIKEVEDKIVDVEEKLAQVKESVEPEKESQIIVESKEPVAPTTEVPPSPPVASSPKPVSKESFGRVNKVLSRADEKVKSYSFTYAPPPDNLARDEWFIRGTKILVELFEDNYVTPEEYYDTIYIDTLSKTAYGYCEDQNRARCADPGKKFDLDYDDVMIKTPYQWVKEITEAEEIGTELVYDRSVLTVRYVKGDTEYYQWIDQFSGLPVRVGEGAPPHKQKWEYRYLAINNVAEDRVLRAET